ncbi:lysylphosphatidylglycerol synthase domain-containing protein [Swingsia samuiensis]|uniref:Lysylphosphatidylglycerol synthetase family protein n=1 Tax=Swingsia samuiensis TaxID=1293412 RepID=A0A4Y6UMH2_9PROT|nr:lysylphosphatidylglycerol synthase domain-containing protein [Swingsia samuiensis]QDH17591.1 lysylphosphatidylglycerol synthetase family protein [Swingsia samuiensis]
MSLRQGNEELDFSSDVEEKPSEKTKWHALLARAPALVGVVLLVAAGFAVWRELQHLSLHDIVKSLEGIPTSSLLAGAGATVLSYFILSFYDRLACLHIRVKVSYARSAFAAFCSYVLSHNLGLAAISGAAVRFRLYKSWGVSPANIAQIIAFCSATYFLGTLALVGSILALEPHSIPVLSHLPAFVVQLCGVACWVVLGAYVFLSRAKQHVKIKSYEIEIPNTKIALAQIVVSAADMAATALIAYSVLPPLPPEAHFGFGTFLAIYIASYTAGLVASVPGGLGVFDTAMLLALKPYLPVSQIMGAILVFRLFYYIIPLVLAGVMFAGHELFLRGEQALVEAGQATCRVRPSRVIRESEADFSVIVATSVQAVVGIALVFYAIIARLPVFHSPFWSAVSQISDLFLTVMGVALVGLALGLSERVTLAWKVSLGVLSFSVALLILRGAPWEAYLTVLLVILLIAPFRGCYYRRAHLLSAPLTPSMLAPFSIWGLGLVGMAWVAVQRHLGPIWWRSMIYDAHTATGRWFLGASALCGVVALWIGMRRARIRFDAWNSENEHHYKNLAHALQDIGPRRPSGLLYDEAKRAAVPFIRSGDFIIGLGDPAGPERNSMAAIWRLRDFAVQEGRKLAFIRVGESFSEIYSDLDLMVWPDGSGESICCSAGDYRGIRAFITSEERQARKRRLASMVNVSSFIPDVVDP